MPLWMRSRETGNPARESQVHEDSFGLRRALPQFFLDPVQLSELLNYASHLWRAGSMKLLTGLLAAMLLLAGAGTSYAVVRIANDRGGQIGRYVERYEQLRASGQTVIIDGLCASSCTIVLGAIPHERNLCNSERQPRLPRSVGFWSSRTCHYQPGGNPDALFDVSIAGPALDR